MCTHTRAFLRHGDRGSRKPCHTTVFLVPPCDLSHRQRAKELTTHQRVSTVLWQRGERNRYHCSGSPYRMRRCEAWLVRVQVPGRGYRNRTSSGRRLRRGPTPGLFHHTTRDRHDGMRACRQVCSPGTGRHLPAPETAGHVVGATVRSRRHLEEPLLAWHPQRNSWEASSRHWPQHRSSRSPSTLWFSTPRPDRSPRMSDTSGRSQVSGMTYHPSSSTARPCG